jgi:hypothetical protein
MNPINLSIINSYMGEIDMPKFENASLPPLVICIDKKYIINIIEKNNQIVLFSSCGKLDLENKQSDENKTTNDSVTWVPCKGMDERFNYKIGRHTTTDLIILHASADPTYLDTTTFREWMQEFVEQIKNWSAIVIKDAISTSTEQKQPDTEEDHMAVWV